VMRQILREPDWTWIAPVLAYPAIFWTLGLGQNAFLTAALLGGFTLLVDRRPGLAGILVGLLCYKPHFGLLVPVGLAFGGHRRAFAVAGATVAGLAGLSVALFGFESWQVYFTTLAHSNAVYASGRIDYAGILTPFGAARLIGFDPAVSYVTQAFVTGSMLLLVAWVWRPGQSRALRAAAILSATLLAVPLALLYDGLLLLVAIGWLVREGREHGFLPWEKTTLLSVYAASMADYAAGSAWHLPLGPLVSLAVLLLALRRCLRATPARPAVRMEHRPGREALAP